MVLFTVIEIVVLCLGGFVFFCSRGRTIAEAGAYAVMTVLMVLSLLSQWTLLVPVPFVPVVMEAGLLATGVLALVRHRVHLVPVFDILSRTIKRYPISFSAVLAGVVYLGVLALVIPPGVPYWKVMGRVLLFEQHGWIGSMQAHDFLGPAFPMNHAALLHMFLRFGSDMGVGLFGFLAYLSIACSTYALSRRYAWPSTAATVTVVVMCLPRLVLHASSPGTEILPAAAGVFCILAAYRAVEKLNTSDVFMSCAGATFAVSDGTSCLVLPLLLLALVCVLLVRRHGGRTLWAGVVKQQRWSLAALAVVTIFSQSWLLGWNAGHHDSWVGTVAWMPLAYNQDGLQGSLANAIRYALESVHPTLPVDRFFRLAFGAGLSQMLQKAAESLPGFISGGTGLAEPFTIHWEPNEIDSWFGPLGFLLVLPAVGYALRKGPRRLKTVAVAMVAYIYLVSLIFAWSPGNARLFTVMVVCSGFFVSFFLPPWRFGRGGKQAFQWVSLLLLFYAVTFNTAKPLVPLSRFIEPDLLRSDETELWNSAHPTAGTHQNIWLRARWGGDRIFEARDYFGDDRVREAAVLMGRPIRLICVTGHLSHIYPFILLQPQAAVSLVTPARLDNQIAAGIQNGDVVLCFGDVPPVLAEDFFPVKAWQGQANALVKVSTVLLKKRKVSQRTMATPMRRAWMRSS